jgi:hypothetical protein
MRGLKVSPDLTLPLDVAGEATAIIAKRGAGKTNTASVIAEELIGAGVQTVILDPVGAWWGIRFAADGESPGLHVPIIGGAHGDVPLEQTAGALIADVVVDSGQSLLIDLSDLPSKAAVGRFVTDFAERLFRRKARDHALVHLILEEADTFAPQKVRGSERMQGAIEQIVRRGRSRGLGVTMITQRSAVLSKDVLTQADSLIVLRTTGPHDLKAISEWVDSRGDAEHGTKVMNSLPGLATGEGWIWNPENDILRRVSFRARKMFDSSRTPKAGEHLEEPKNAASIDIETLGEQIAATAEKAKSEDPSELRKRIRELEVELSHKNDVTVQTETVEVPVLLDGDLTALETLVQRAEQAIHHMPLFTKSLEEAVSRIQTTLQHVGSPPKRMSNGPIIKPAAIAKAMGFATSPPVAAATPAGGNDVTRPQQKVLDALAWLESVGISGEKLRVGFLADYSPSSGNFNNLLSQLKKDGLITYPQPGIAELTPEGRALAQVSQVALTTVELHEKIYSKLSNPQIICLKVIIDQYPDSISREDVANATGYSSGSGNFNNILSRLKSLALIERPLQGYVRAAPLLFLEA